MGAEKRKTVGLISPGARLYRDYLLAQLATDYDVWLISDTAASWELPFITGQSIVDRICKSQILDAIRSEQSRGREINGLLCWDERYVIATADAASELGLPTAGRDGVRGCKDKYVTRATLYAAGLKQPKFDFCASIPHAVEAAQEIGFPLVVKPRGMGASIGVAKVETADELRQYFEFAVSVSDHGELQPSVGALVEEFIEGEEISVDGVTVHGEYHPLFVARKRTGFAPYFAEVGHSVSSSDPLLKDHALIDSLRRAHSAIGFEDGWTHSEVKISASEPVIVEINARLGGDLIPKIAGLANGVSAGSLAGSVACGEFAFERVSTQCSEKHSLVEFVYPPFDMFLKALDLPKGRTTKDGYVVAISLVGEKERFRLPPSEFVGRVACVIAVGDRLERCIELADQEKRRVIPRGVPLDAE